MPSETLALTAEAESSRQLSLQYHAVIIRPTDQEAQQSSSLYALNGLSVANATTIYQGVFVAIILGLFCITEIPHRLGRSFRIREVAWPEVNQARVVTKK